VKSKTGVRESTHQIRRFIFAFRVWPVSVVAYDFSTAFRDGGNISSPETHVLYASAASSRQSSSAPSDWCSGVVIKMGRRKEHFGRESSFNVKRAATEEPVLRGRPILRFGTRPLCGKERQDLRCRKRFTRAVWTSDRDNRRAFVQGRFYHGSQGSALGSNRRLTKRPRVWLPSSPIRINNP
jgi:hypothetical protein